MEDPVKDIKIVHSAPVPAPVGLPKWFMAALLGLLAAILLGVLWICFHPCSMAPEPAPPPPPPWPEPTPKTPIVFEKNEYQTDVGQPVVIRVKSLGPVKWLADAKLSKANGKSLIFTPDKEGEFEVGCYTVHGIELSDVFKVKVKCGKGPLPPPPPEPAPIPDPGFRVLFIYEAGSLVDMPAEQRMILTGKKVRDFLNANCVMGPDNKTKEWRVWDKDVDTSAAPPLWQNAMKRPHASLPWVLVSNGTSGFEGPLPATDDAFIALASKYLPKLNFERWK